MDRREYEELVAVHDEGAEVHLHIRENRKGTVKRMIVLVDDHEKYIRLCQHALQFQTGRPAVCSIDGTKVTWINIKRGCIQPLFMSETKGDPHGWLYHGYGGRLGNGTDIHIVFIELISS